MNKVPRTVTLDKSRFCRISAGSEAPVRASSSGNAGRASCQTEQLYKAQISPECPRCLFAASKMVLDETERAELWQTLAHTSFPERL